MSKSFAIIWAREETSSLRNMRLRACLTELFVIQSFPRSLALPRNDRQEALPPTSVKLEEEPHTRHSHAERRNERIILGSRQSKLTQQEGKNQSLASVY